MDSGLILRGGSYAKCLVDGKEMKQKVQSMYLSDGVSMYVDQHALKGVWLGEQKATAVISVVIQDNTTVMINIISTFSGSMLYFIISSVY